MSGHPGIELRGAGGYQLVPPSALMATARDPAGRYRWAEPWTTTHLCTDLAELPDWLRDLWIACDRAPAPPHHTGGTRRTRRRVHTVVASVDTTTVCTLVPSGGIGSSGLAALPRDRATMEACAACMGWRADGGNFTCPLPGHAEARPSASLYWNANGELVFRDWHRRHGKEFWALSEVYAAVVSGRIRTDEHGRARTLSEASMATWSLRLLVDAKRLEPYPVILPPLPDDAPGSVGRLYEGLTRLFGAKWAYEPGQPTMFTRSFAQDWCGVGEKTAWVGTHWLLQRQILVPAGTHQGRPLYLPGALP